jgi:hypothetical protein
MLNTLLADVAPPIGLTTKFSYCFKVVNLDRYPDHLFFARLGSQNKNLPVLYRLIEPNTCIDPAGYRPIVTITAIPKNQIQPKDLEQPNPDVNYRDFTILQNKALQAKLLKDETQIQPPRSIPILHENGKMEDVIEIQTLTPDSLQITVTRSIHTLNWIIFPILGVILLGYLVWKRRRQPA